MFPASCAPSSARMAYGFVCLEKSYFAGACHKRFIRLATFFVRVMCAQVVTVADGASLVYFLKSLSVITGNLYIAIVC